MKNSKVIPHVLLCVFALGAAVMLTGCTKTEKTIAGAAIGAGAGVAIGAATGGTGGAIAGGLLGGAAGGIIGNSMGGDKN